MVGDYRLDACVTELWHMSLRVSQGSTPLADEPAQMTDLRSKRFFITPPLNAKRAAAFKTNRPLALVLLIYVFTTGY